LVENRQFNLPHMYLALLLKRPIEISLRSLVLDNSKPYCIALFASYTFSHLVRYWLVTDGQTDGQTDTGP